MKYADDILGLTFAEIAFILMYVIFANNFLAETSIKNEIEELKEEKVKYEEQISEINTELEKQTEKLRSLFPPRCFEIGIKTIKGDADNWLFTATILDENLYEIDGKQLSFRQITELYKEDIEIAKENKCLHRIKIGHQANLDLETYLRAKAKLIGVFYHKEI